MAGLTQAGIEIDSFEEILDLIEQDQKTNISANLDVEADSVVGQINSIVTDKIHEAYEMLEALWQSAYPDTASGTSLSYVASITGTLRRAATKARVTATVNLNAGTTLPAGSVAYVDGDETMKFETIEAVTNSGGAAADFEVEMDAVEYGSAIFANSGTLTEIESPVIGWNSVTNALDAVRGRDLETDVELRARRQEEIAFAGSCTVDAIRADILNLTGVDSCTVFENETSFVNSDSMPPHSIEVLVSGVSFDEDELFQQILDSKPAGVLAHGSETGTALDSAGNSHDVAYSLPTEVDAYIDLTIGTNSQYTTDTAIKTAISEWGQAFAPGDSLYASELVCFVQELDGIDYVDVSQVAIDDSPSLSTVDLIITSRQLVVLDTSRISITVV